MFNGANVLLYRCLLISQMCLENISNSNFHVTLSTIRRQIGMVSPQVVIWSDHKVDTAVYSNVATLLFGRITQNCYDFVHFGDNILAWSYYSIG